mmetsp:Transcript_9856/g.20573  ORF Transcript_9856/g.20573 Transcript_9856/m.20573 type:complete len:790 (-) Transcript_9856:247-2616(-)
MDFGGYIGNNSRQIDAAECERTTREKHPDLLQDDEYLVFAFQGRAGKGRDTYMLTSKRLLLKDKKGITGKRTAFKSVPYSSVRAFSVETAGRVDGDQELKVYARGVGRVDIDFENDVPVHLIYKFLSQVVIQGKGSGKDTAGAGAFIHDSDVSVGEDTGVLDLVGSNFSQIDNAEVERKLKSRPDILLNDETVEMAFQCGRDSFILTSKRLLKIDVQGVSGKKVEYLSILWPCIKAFSVETAGNVIDRDSELTLFLNLPDKDNRAEGFPRNSRTRCKIDFRDGNADLFAVQRFFSDKVLGVDSVQHSQYADGMTGHHDSGSDSFLAWLGDDNRLIDASEADAKFHSDPPILQNCETVEMAFRGRRDMMLFTGKRVIFVDVQGFLGMGKKVEYISVPWTTVTAFSARTAGSWIDNDSEMCLWLDFDDVFNPIRGSQDDPPPPPIPRRSWLEIDFQKDKVDMFMIHRYLSERCMRVSAHNLKSDSIPVSSELLRPTPPGTGEDLVNWLGNNAVSIDDKEADSKFHEAGILQEDEHVAFAFKTGRDSLYLTNKRLFVVDTQGVTGKRKEYMSVPWDSIRVWSVESAGNFDLDMEMRCWFKGFWDNKVKQDLRSGRADIIAIQQYIAHFVIGNANGIAALKYAQSVSSMPAGSMDKFLSYVTNDAIVKDPQAISEKLHTSPRILQEDETLESAYKCGRDLFLFSTKRIIEIDVKGITGKSVEYKSYPLRYNKAFKIETEGHLLNGPGVKVYTEDENIDQNFAKGSSDIWPLHQILSKKLLDEEHVEIDDDIRF